MRISTISIRVLLYVAAKKSSEKLVSTEECARCLGISKSACDSAMKTLKKNGYITTKKGKHGGYRVAKELEKITLEKFAVKTFLRDSKKDGMVEALAKCLTNITVQDVARHYTAPNDQAPAPKKGRVTVVIRPQRMRGLMPQAGTPNSVFALGNF